MGNPFFTMGNCEPCCQGEGRPAIALSSAMTTDEIAEEHERLGELTSSFIKKVQRGCPCVYVDHVSKSRRAAEYCVDAAVSNFMVLDLKGGSVLLKFRMSNILEFHECYDGEPSNLFPSRILKCLHMEERQRLILGIYLADDGCEQRFYLVIKQDNVGTTISATEFVEAMEVLKSYADRGLKHDLAECSDTDDGLEGAIQKKRIMTFCRKAVKGCRCSFLDEQNLSRHSGVYSFDKGIEKFTISLEQGHERKIALECLVNNIVAWYTYAEESKRDTNTELFPADLMKLVMTDERKHTILGLYDAETGERQRFYLVVDTVVEFVEVMEILASSAQQQRNEFRV